MALKKWTDGDVITARSANNKGIRKGTTAEVAAIAVADFEVGDVFYNESQYCLQSLYAKSANKYSNNKILLGADSTVTTITGNTATQVKDIDFVKDAIGFSGNRIFVVARFKNSNNASSGYVRIRKNGGGADALALSTTSTNFTILTGSFDISADADGYITLEVFCDSGVGHTVTLQAIEFYGV